MKRIPLVLILLLFCNLVAAEERPVQLTLEEVTAAALRAFPGLLSTEQRKAIAAGEFQTAEGAFDTTLKSKNRWSIAGVYQNDMNDVTIEQPTSLGGTSFFGGWRQGSGYYPIYEGKSQTATDGEVSLGVNIPLWRNREIDSRRAKLQQAELGKMVASHDFDQALLEVRRTAGLRYWDWVMAGQRLKIAERLLAIAEQRDAGIRARAAAGDIPDIEVIDNQRAILERRERKVAAQRLLEQAAIQLSLYWRDAEGQPQLPSLEQLPGQFPEPEPALNIDQTQALSIAQGQRPELKRLQLQKQQTETEWQLQENQQAPAVDFSVLGAKDMGYSSQKINRDELYLGLNVEIPLQQRVAGGRAQAAAAQLQRLKYDMQLMADRINNEIKDVLSALHAARQRVQLSQQQWQAAQALEQGEQNRFELGESTLLFVNLREIANGDAAIMAAEAKTNLLKAHVDYQAILGNPIQLDEIGVD